MKRYTVFPYFAGLAAAVLLVASFLIPAPASARFEPSFASFEFDVADFDKYTVHYLVPEVAVIRQDDAGGTLPLSARTTPVLHPDYAESLKTDALNFVETRLRC